MECSGVSSKTDQQGGGIMDYRDEAIELVEDGMVDPMMMLTACLKWMSQDEVRDMLNANELLRREEA